MTLNDNSYMIARDRFFFARNISHSQPSALESPEIPFYQQTHLIRRKFRYLYLHTKKKQIVNLQNMNMANF